MKEYLYIEDSQEVSKKNVIKFWGHLFHHCL